MKILVTGTAGFIGYHLAKKLLARGDEVVGIDNINDYYDINLKYGRLAELGINRNEVKDGTKVISTTNTKHSFIKLDLSDREGMEKLFKDENFDAVCHLAAQAGVRYSIENPHAYVESNVIGFLNVLEGCRQNKVNNLCFASSSSVYGLNQSQPFKTTDHTDHPVSLYAATKKSNEMMAHTYAHLYGINTTGVRFFTVYGPWGRPDMAPMLFTDAILNDRAIKIFNHGKMSRDFTYVGDIVDGLIKILDKPATVSKDWDAKVPSPDGSSASYRLYNIGNNAPVKLMDFVASIEKALGTEAKKDFQEMQAGDVVSTYADVSSLMNEFGYKPNTDLDDGIQVFIQWYKEFYTA